MDASSNVPPVIHSLRDMTAIVLAGGRGTRLEGLHAGLPKPLIPCAGHPFLEWSLAALRDLGVNDFVISTGHLADRFDQHLRQRPKDGSTIRLARELAPLGTGGAIRFAWQAASARDVIVVNGDSLLMADLGPALEQLEPADVDGVLIGVQQPDASRFGTLVFDGNQRLLQFAEKQPGAGVVNAGIYLLKSRLLSRIPAMSPLSIERDVFPEWLTQGVNLRVCVRRGEFIDIGTPETLAQADQFLTRHWCWSTRP
jgi:D-glycero-alpha-D-manno-heptose 1-phosphate guanylyltransferase